MARDTRRAFGLRALGAIASAMIGLAAVATPAFAATVSGADSFVSAGQKEMTVLTVDGAAGETVYVRVTRDGEILADRLEYTLSEAQGSISLDFSHTEAFDPSRTYVVTAFASRDEAEVLYEGTIEPIYATLAGGGSQLIAVSTKGEADAERAFEAPAEITVGEDRVFTLVENEGEATGFSYTAADSSASVTGTLSYVTDDGTVVAQTTVDGITPTQSKTVEIATTVQDSDGNYYRVIRYSNSVSLSYLANNATVRVKPAELEDGFYTVSIRYVDEEGNTLLAFSNSITKKFSYTAETYVFKKGVAYKLEGEGTLAFAPGDEYSQSENPTATFTYRKVVTEGEGAEALPLTFVVENIGTGLTDNRRITLANPIPTKWIEPGEKYTYTAEEVYVDTEGNRYVPVVKSYSFSYDKVAGGATVCTIYVAPEGYDVALDPYDITVDYVDIATQKVVRSETITISETNADTDINLPEQFVEDGTTYVVYSGQNFSHNYFSANRSYRVLCRDVNDVAHANVDISQITTNMVEPEGEEDGTTAGGRTTNAAGVGATAADGTTTIALPDGTLTAIDNGDGTGAVTTLDGQDVDSVHIDDLQNPLAGPGGLGGAGLAGITPATGVALSGALVAVLIPFFVAWKRRKDQSDNAETDGEVR